MVDTTKAAGYRGATTLSHKYLNMRVSSSDQPDSQACSIGSPSCRATRETYLG